MGPNKPMVRGDHVKIIGVLSCGNRRDGHLSFKTRLFHSFGASMTGSVWCNVGMMAMRWNGFPATMSFRPT
jgi:hypothetical protein